MESVYETLVKRARAMEYSIKGNREKNQGYSRTIIAFAGPPGSGKSTIAAEVARQLNAGLETPTTTVVPMDGFHYSRAKLDTFTNAEEAHARRGAAWTFDAKGVVGLCSQLARTKHLPPDEIPDVLAPSFDHGIKDPVAGDIIIESHITMVILEGLWLLHNEEPWSQIRGLVDECWFVDVDQNIARERVAARHVMSGLALTWEDALRKTDANDVLNGDEVRSKLLAPDVTVWSVQEDSAEQAKNEGKTPHVSIAAIHESVIT